ncbi:hypothetical protein [Rhizobium rhizogenes]|uniref:hypothetical protein n=1 Tax=Rhizobium rhizogenes TaxID=359 RepID=UPI0004D949BD|nr:hypothetical protein [Rhizobium rhizogenes]KEA07106.1 hypothetical protein CN09_09065 [Rhizobium rhizogenes]NTI80476.1 hypothetical protein [Rhizobium rhizogenes]NTJ22662.1 hypothetical protein [Rhizobium rhizogenes]QUE81366.1 hypothetical protein EML492_06040 [Rhizobium rhizogenes]TQO80539.1 hypothetical protein FFE80_05400 [Rhizobium rhizogenes]
MNVQMIMGMLNILLAAIPQMTSLKVVSQTVAWLLQIEPVLVQFSEDLGPIISNIVAAFAANPATTATQIAALKVLDAKTDKDFDDAISAYLASNPDPVAVPSSNAAAVSTESTDEASAAPLSSAG